LLELAPVGALVEAHFGADGSLRRLRVVRLPSAEAAVGRQARQVEHSSEGFDRNWEPSRRRFGDEPEEESARQILKAPELEINDEASPTPAAPALETELLSLPPIKAINRAGERLEGDIRAVVAGYRWDDSDATLVLEERALSDIGDPRQEHLDLSPWQEVEVRVGGSVRDHDRSFLQLDRVDGLGAFYLEDWGAALDFHDVDLPFRLRPGAQVRARAVPDAYGSFSATLVPWARAHLATAPSEVQSKAGGRHRAYPATVVTPPDARGFAIVELDHKDLDSGLTHRFRVRDKDLKWIGHETVAGGEALLLSVQPARGDRRAGLQSPTTKVAKIAEREAALELRGNWIRLGPADLPFRAVSELVRAVKDRDWAAEVWRFYEGSLHLSSRNLFAQQVRQTLEAPVALLPFLFRERRKLEQAHGVGLFVRQAEAEIEIASSNRAGLEAARRAFEEIFAFPRRQVRVPSATRGWLLGNGVANLRRLQDQAGVTYLSLDDDIVTVVASSRTTLDRVLQEFPRRARGLLTVPAGKAGALIGRGGETIRRLCKESGCRANSTGRDAPWLLEGPSAGHLYLFISLASAEVPGATGSVQEDEPFSLVPEPSRPARGVPPSHLRVATPDFLLDVDDAEVRRLAADHTTSAIPTEAQAADAGRPSDKKKRRKETSGALEVRHIWALDAKLLIALEAAGDESEMFLGCSLRSPAGDIIDFPVVRSRLSQFCLVVLEPLGGQFSLDDGNPRLAGDVRLSTWFSEAMDLRTSDTSWVPWTSEYAPSDASDLTLLLYIDTPPLDDLLAARTWLGDD
ncbi:KH domain-containing protein, partial [Brevundimonas sp.]